MDGPEEPSQEPTRGDLSRVTSCEALTTNGERCQAPPLRGGRFCFHHDPSKAAAREEARRRGGKAAHGMDPEAPRPEVKLRAIGDVLRLFEVASSDILQQPASLGRARALAYLGGHILRALELSELERRIAALEQRAKEPEPQPWRWET